MIKGKIEGTWSKGRPRKIYLDKLVKIAGRNYKNELIHLAQDRVGSKTRLPMSDSDSVFKVEECMTLSKF